MQRQQAPEDWSKCSGPLVAEDTDSVGEKMRFEGELAWRLKEFVGWGHVVDMAGGLEALMNLVVVVEGLVGTRPHETARVHCGGVEEDSLAETTAVENMVALYNFSSYFVTIEQLYIP